MGTRGRFETTEKVGFLGDVTTEPSLCHISNVEGFYEKQKAYKNDICDSWIGCWFSFDSCCSYFGKKEKEIVQTAVLPERGSSFFIAYFVGDCHTSDIGHRFVMTILFVLFQDRVHRMFHTSVF